MKAAQAVSIGKVECVEVDTPGTLQDDLLIQTELASICGSDLHMVDNGWGINDWPAPPGHPGHEAIGRVVKSKIRRINEGDRVLTVPHIWRSKCFAEYQVVDPAHVLKIPNDIDIHYLLMAQQLGTVIFAAKRLSSVRGLTCVVVGQGSAGIFWNFLLRRMGADRIITVDPIVERRNIGKNFGATHAIDVISDNATKAVMDLTNGEGADVVIEAVGSTTTLNQVLHLVRQGGQIVLFGLPVSKNPVPFDFSTFFVRCVNAFSILGSQDEPGLVSFNQAVDLIVSGEIDVGQIITHKFSIEKISEAFQLARIREDGVMKIALNFS